mmetsp:Transcript_6948/g.23076  ORF Transcript_6948/g.23076 Transcript_6948/m.23076 type:complete len:338 (-) Transcript_6948:774-1787(-)
MSEALFMVGSSPREASSPHAWRRPMTVVAGGSPAPAIGGSVVAAFAEAPPLLPPLTRVADCSRSLYASAALLMDEGCALVRASAAPRLTAAAALTLLFALGEAPRLLAPPCAGFFFFVFGRLPPSPSLSLPVRRTLPSPSSSSLSPPPGKLGKGLYDFLSLAALGSNCRAHFSLSILRSRQRLSASERTELVCTSLDLAALITSIASWLASLILWSLCSEASHVRLAREAAALSLWKTSPPSRITFFSLRTRSKGLRFLTANSLRAIRPRAAACTLAAAAYSFSSSIASSSRFCRCAKSSCSICERFCATCRLWSIPFAWALMTSAASCCSRSCCST